MNDRHIGRVDARTQQQNIQEIIDKLTQSKSYQPLLKNYHKISSRLIYWIKLAKIGLCEVDKLDSLIEKIDLLLASTQYQKYGHSFPLFAQSIKKYLVVKKQKVRYFCQQQKLKIIESIEKSQFFKQRNFDEMITEQIAIQKNSFIQKYFKKLIENKVLIKNTHCICCSQAFLKNSTISNFDTAFRVIKGINSKKDLDNVVLKKYFNAVCNKGGGVIFIGARNIGRQIFIEGLPLQSIEELTTIQNQIRIAYESLKRFCQIEIKNLNVYDDYFFEEAEKYSNFNTVIRVCVFPKIEEKLAYIETALNKSYKIYQAYNLSQTYEPVQIIPKNFSEKPGQSLYTYIFDKYKSQNWLRNCHQNIKCLEPFKHDIGQSSFEGQMNANKISHNTSQVYLHVQQIPFVYKKASLLIVCNKFYDRIIDLFGKFLTDAKIKYKLSKPFDKYFNEDMRSIWVIDHDLNFTMMKQCLHRCEDQISKNGKSITLLPVLQKLEVQKNKLQEADLNSLEKKFKRYFNKDLLYKEVKIKENNCVYVFEFANKSEAIFAYMTLEQLKIRPYFIKNFAGPPTLKDKIKY